MNDTKKKTTNSNNENLLYAGAGGGTLLSFLLWSLGVSLFLVKTAFLFLFLSLYGITLFVSSFTFKSTNKRL